MVHVSNGYYPSPVISLVCSLGPSGTNTALNPVTASRAISFAYNGTFLEKS